MTKIWLVVVFFVNGDPHIIDGWFPREAPTPAVCEERAAHARAYLDEYSPVPWPSQVVCTHMEPKALSPEGPET